jgi:hypothetical protein
MTGQQPAPGAATAAHRELELSAAAHPGFCGKHARPPPSRGEGQGHTLTLARPFRRRAARTARPALVRMRSRNPCVLARRRLFGWNVRLLTGGSTFGRGGGVGTTGVITGSRAARRASAQRTAQGKAFESVHGTRIPKRRSNQRHPQRPDGPIIAVGGNSIAVGRNSTIAVGRNSGLPNATRPASLGCGQPARPRGTGWRGPATAVQRRPGHGAECGVHSLWIRLLIRMWGREVNTR